MNIADYFVGKLKAGQADFEGWHGSRLARVEHDGSTWFYDPPEKTQPLEQFKIAAEVAWGMDSDCAEIWGTDGYARVSFE